MKMFNYNHIYISIMVGYGLGVSLLGLISSMLSSNFILFMLMCVSSWGMIFVVKDFFEFLDREARK